MPVRARAGAQRESRPGGPAGRIDRVGRAWRRAARPDRARRPAELGVTRIPRGPVTTTRTNPAGLTSRQLQVLRLLGDGLTNAQIAQRLVVSVRTVDSHVAAVLDKLGAQNRRDAASRAAEIGVLDSKGR